MHEAGHEISKRRLQGLWLGTWDLDLHSVTGPSPSRLCVMLPGQGSARPGMFSSELRRLAPLREVVAEVDEVAAEFDVITPSSYLAGRIGDNEGDTSAAANLALCAVIVGLWRSIEWTLPRPSLVTGFSLGEYPALVISGHLDLPTMARVVALRDRACPAPGNLGRMIAVAACPDALKPCLEGINYQVSNLCAPEQTTISVAHADIDNALRRLTAQSLRATLLKGVPQPYHTTWLSEAAATFASALEGLTPLTRASHQLSAADEDVQHSPVHVTKPGEMRGLATESAVPLLSSVTGQLVHTQLTSKQLWRLAADQLTTPVDWPHQIRLASELGCGSFVELGPGGAIGRFAAACLGGRRHRIVRLDELLPRPSNSQPTDSKRTKTTGPMAEALKAIVARVTGFEVTSISVEDRFQEDLGIDSIKRMEVVLDFLDTAGIELDAAAVLGDVGTLAEALEAITKSAEAGVSAQEDAVVFERLREVDRSQPLKDCEVQANATVIGLENFLEQSSTLAWPAASNLVLRADGQIWRSRQSAGNMHKDVTADVITLGSLCRVLRTLPDDVQSIVVVTAENTRPILCGVGAMLRSLALENQRLRTRHLVIDDGVSTDAAISLLAAHELAIGSSTEVHWRGGTRYAPVLETVVDDRPSPSLTGLKTVFAFGGCGGLGRTLLIDLCRTHQIELWLAGRSTLENVAAVLADFESMAVSVHYRQVDARDSGQVETAMAEVKEHGDHIDLVLNAVGVEHSDRLEHHSDDDIDLVITTKILAAVAIANASMKSQAGMCVHFSSVAGRWGNSGQAPYAAANQAVMELCKRWTVTHSGCIQLAMNWPPLDSIGMTDHAVIRARLLQLGFNLLKSDRACELFTTEIAAPRPGVIDLAPSNMADFFNLAHADHTRWAPLLGKRSPDGFERQLSLTSDSWLNDHQVSGVSLLPAAFALVQAVAIADLANELPRSVINFEILNAFVVASGESRLKVTARIGDTGLELTGRGVAPMWRATLAEPAPLDDQSGPMILSSAWRKPPYNARELFHGPSFQVLEAITDSANGGLAARISLLRLARLTGHQIGDRLLLIFDAAFQLLALCGLEQGRGLALPIAVGRLEFSPEVHATEQLLVTATIGTSDDEEIRGRVDLRSAEGVLLGRLNAIRCAILMQDGENEPPRAERLPD